MVYSVTLFFNKNIVFPVQAENSNFSADFRLKIFLWCGGLIVSALVPGSSDPGSSPGWGHCVVFLGKTAGCPERARQLHLAHSDSQSARDLVHLARSRIELAT